MALLNRGGSSVAIEAIDLRSARSEIVSAHTRLVPPRLLASGARAGIVVRARSAIPRGHVRVTVTYRAGDRRERVILAATLAKAVKAEPRTAPPRPPASGAGPVASVRLASVKIGRLTGGKVRLDVELVVRNALPRRLALAGLDAALSISGSPFGKASAPALTLDPRGQRRVTLVVEASRATVSETIRAMRGKRARFSLRGALRLAGAGRVAFSASAGAEVFGAPNLEGMSRALRRLRRFKARQKALDQNKRR